MQTPKKITHLNFAKGFRGGERQTLLLIKELAQRGYRQKVLTRHKSALAKRLLEIENVEVVTLFKPYIVYLREVKESVLLHAHETKAAQFCLFAYMWYGIPYIVTRRVDIAIKNNFFNRRIYENARFTVVLSKAIQSQVMQLSEGISTVIIPSAVTPLCVEQERVREIRSRFKGKFLIGHIAALDGAKGHEYLIEAIRGLREEYSDIHLLLLGEGKEEMRYRKQAEGLDTVTFEGFVENVGDYLQALDLFVFPSLHEGLGSILLDVMYAKVPIIASDVGGIPDIIHDRENGLLVKPKDAEDIFSKIVAIYKDPDLAKALVVQGSEDVVSFSLGSMVQKYQELYGVSDA